MNGKVKTLWSFEVLEFRSQKGLSPFRPSVGFLDLGHMGPSKTLMGYTLIS
jgi:hypothetical protein